MVKGRRMEMFFLAIATMTSVSAIQKCPQQCRCDYDYLGRKTVTCDVRSVGNNIPVFDMDRDTKVLTITSAEEQPGQLSVGPVFAPLSQLEEVHITRANVPAVADNAFWGLRHLRLLNLTDNNITVLLDSHLRGMRALEALHLDNNNIDTVASATFMSLERLEILTLAQNRLHSLTPRMFYLLSNLKTLDLSGNPIRELEPDVLKDLPMLRTLRCSKCSISRVKSLAYKMIPELEILDLRDNRLTSLAPEEYLDLKYLKFVYLDENKIVEIKDYTFRNLGLQFLGLSNNYIEKIYHLGFEDCSIMDLDLSFNKLSYASLHHLSPIIAHIHDLRMGGNHIKVDQLQELLKKAIRLKKLNVNSLHLKQLPHNLFVSQLKLEILNLSNNALMFIPVDILHSLPSLRVLDLKNNNFRGLPEIILRRLDRLQEIHLNHNPWSCDQCHIPQLKMWLNNSKAFRDGCQPDVDAPKCLKCQAPLEMYDKPIIEVDGLELQPCPEGTFDLAAASAGSSGFTLILAVITATVVVVLLIIILVVGIIMYNRHSAFYYTHENDARHHFYDNPALHSNHTDITMDGDLDELPTKDNASLDRDQRDSSHHGSINPQGFNYRTSQAPDVDRSHHGSNQNRDQNRTTSETSRRIKKMKIHENKNS